MAHVRSHSWAKWAVLKFDAIHSAAAWIAGQQVAASFPTRKRSVCVVGRICVCVGEVSVCGRGVCGRGVCVCGG